MHDAHPLPPSSAKKKNDWIRASSPPVPSLCAQRQTLIHIYNYFYLQRIHALIEIKRIISV
jgi:cytoplasmic iron level regulating protein YaaA (DUF328/UPF0246 family)